MSKMVRKRAWFRVPVDFTAASEAGLRHAIKSYAADPSWETTGFDVDYGVYWWRQGKVRRETDAAGEISK